MLLKINKEETINWSGKFRAPLVNQQVLPRAVDNNLPIWIAVGGTPESVIRAGVLGLPLTIAIIGGSPSQFKPLFNLYREEYKKAGHDLAKIQVGVHVHSFFGEDSDKVAADYYPLYAAQMDRVGKSRGWSPYTKYQFDYGRQKEGALFVSDAEQAIDKILSIQEMFGLTRFAAHMDIGAPSHKDMMKSIEIFGTKIAPKVREALKK
ncbi:LLM class flavin-dependent oxidoreductase [Pedobacter lusitanus]|uniref:LLM class flavin-dependent oxidoreductase n=1 Tax=Pedobacter lusitanus TaxID=1503925 RepID=UPI000B25A642|nr:LLM class flavin-dependent oxidoreductase [Pedobacter lusitanus]